MSREGELTAAMRHLQKSRDKRKLRGDRIKGRLFDSFHFSHEGDVGSFCLGDKKRGKVTIKETILLKEGDRVWSVLQGGFTEKALSSERGGIKRRTRREDLLLSVTNWLWQKLGYCETSLNLCLFLMKPLA